MSASLVGSEMCIRDRNPRLSANGAGEPAVAWAIHAGVSFKSVFGSVRAVSYTHLTLPTICSV
eukprot:6964805-Alexandrium_andersonii.AAC.1